MHPHNLCPRIQAYYLFFSSRIHFFEKTRSLQKTIGFKLKVFVKIKKNYFLFSPSQKFNFTILLVSLVSLPKTLDVLGVQRTQVIRNMCPVY